DVRARAEGQAFRDRVEALRGGAGEVQGGDARPRLARRDRVFDAQGPGRRAAPAPADPAGPGRSDGLARAGAVLPADAREQPARGAAETAQRVSIRGRAPGTTAQR